jgi:hypothetical protein
MDTMIPVKTAKALLAISQRSYDLPRRLRTLLILINGKTNVASLKKDAFFIASLKKEDSLLENIEAMLAELKKLGLIELAKDNDQAVALIASFQNQYADFLRRNMTLEQIESGNDPDFMEKIVTSNPQKEELREPGKKPVDITDQQASKSRKTEQGIDQKIVKAKKELEAILRSIMGNDYSLVANKVASCDSAERFTTMLHGFEDIVQNYGSRKMVEKLKSQFKDFY